MSSTRLRPSQPVQYDPKTIDRADRALRCAPFRLKLFATMRNQSVELRAIAGTSGVDQEYTHQPIAELAAENELLWLIQVGLLRREVDGQGLTDSFRLTPLGHLLVEKWQDTGEFASATWGDRLKNGLQRWLRLPDWMR
ncbi:Npun_F0494 family protein [Leptolyngbya ohadii]|uniref:Npun_F0494 family protein n=1 Tax=Leptolyngbya ohadii TaxID=1962290 RepID=UPI000B59B4B4|nr:Npun_F0494 family protein [Leptolyngbya ohadii]